MMAWLEEGHGVQLGSFGSFHPSVKSKGSDDPDEVEVRRTRLVFYPSHELKQRIKGMSYSTENTFKTKEEADPDAGGDDGSTEMD